jgi:uncharacterized protein YbjT (DUF2867 family)
MQTILGANGTIGSLLAKELTVFTNQVKAGKSQSEKSKCNR